MMIDKRSTFARELSIPAAQAAAKFGEAIPLGVNQDQGGNYPLYLVVNVPVAAAGGTSITIELVTDDNASLTTPTSVVSLGTFALAALTAGAQLYSGAIPVGNYETFMGIRLTVVGTFSTGKLNIFLTLDPPQNRFYPEANN